MFQKQVIMRRVLYALAPIFLFSTYLYGWRVPALTAMVYALAILTEYVFEKARGKKVSEAVLVTAGLYALSLPPGVPFWIAAVGIIFAVPIGKEVYGLFGRNVFNPAITGRLFIYISFPVQLQQSWMTPGQLGPVPFADAISSATPMQIMRGTAEGSVDWLQMLLGFRAGSIGESAILLIVIAAIYMIATKTAQWRLILSTFLAALATTSAFYFTGIATDIAPHLAMMSGSILYVAVFMSTDPVSAPNNPRAQWVYGAIIGSVSMLVRTFAGFPEGTSFGVMMGNVFASFLDEIIPKPPKKSKKKTQTKKPVKEVTSAKEAREAKESAA